MDKDRTGDRSADGVPAAFLYLYFFMENRSENLLPPGATVLTPALLREIYRPRLPDSHKGTYGMAVLAGGQKGSAGALILAARAAGRAGAGRVLGILPDWGYGAFQTAVPEAQSVTSGMTHIMSFGKIPENVAAGIGPGLGQEPDTADALRRLLTRRKAPLVLDADALNILSDYPDWLRLVPENSILTPHPGEFQRIFGETESRLQAVEKARLEAMKYNVIIVLKGHHTAICTPGGKTFINTTDSPALATAGSGDVLTGIITGLLAQDYFPENAACLGVWLHGYAGMRCAEAIGVESTIADDIAQYLGEGFELLRSGIFPN